MFDIVSVAGSHDVIFALADEVQNHRDIAAGVRLADDSISAAAYSDPEA